jgi:chromosome partitioning protein
MSEATKHTREIAVGSQKGGVGKTSNTLHIAAALGEKGRSCLIIDLDGNCGATRGLGAGTDWLGTFEVLLGEQNIQDVIVSSDPVEGTELPANVELVPARRNLEDFEHEYRRRNKFNDPSNTLAEPLASLRGRYDYIFLDTAPNASAPTIASYRSADWFVLSTEASRLSVDGLNDALTDIVAVREAGNPNLRLLGVVMCKVDSRTRVAMTYMERIRHEFAAAGELGAFDTVVNRATALERAQADGKTLFQTEPEHKVTGQFRDLANEIEARLAAADRINQPHPGLTPATPEAPENREAANA